MFLSLDEPGEEDEEGVTYLTLLAASQQTRAANHTTDKASLVSPCVSWVKVEAVYSNYSPLSLHLQWPTVSPSHKSHSPTHEPPTVTPTHSPAHKPPTVTPTHSPAHKPPTVTPTHSPGHKPGSQGEFPSSAHRKKSSWGRSEVRECVCCRLPLHSPLLSPLSPLPTPSRSPAPLLTLNLPPIESSHKQATTSSSGRTH